MLDKAVEKILERTSKYKSHLKGDGAREKRLAQETVASEDIPLIVECYNNKPTSIREFVTVEGGGEDFDDGWWVKTKESMPVVWKENRIYFGDIWIDTERLYISSSVVIDNTGDEPKFVCYLLLQGYQALKPFVGEPTRDNSKLFCFFRQICEVKELHEFNGYKYEKQNYENYYVAKEGMVFTGHVSPKQYMTPLVPTESRPKKKSNGNRNGNRYDHIMLTDTTGKVHPVNIHKLVATVWVPNDDPLKTHVNHMDLNPKNNAADNLEWCTPAYNFKYSPVARALKKALPDIDCHEWFDEAHNITEAVLQGEDCAELVGKAVRKIIEREHLASAS